MIDLMLCFVPELPALSNLNLNRCNISDNGCKKFSRKLLRIARLPLSGCDFIFNNKLFGLLFYTINIIGGITFVTLSFFFTGLENLKVLNLGFNVITDTCLIHLKGDFKSLACFVFIYSSWSIVKMEAIYKLVSGHQ